MQHTALIVIDAQESFRHRPYWSHADAGADRERYFASQQALVDGCAARGVPVVQVFHTEQDGPFSTASGNVRTLEELAIAPDVVFHKQVHSALAGTGLMAWLVAHGIRRLVVSGIRTEQCCETTTRHASDSGFDVDFASEATLTFPIRHAGSGRVYTGAEIRERTELVLDGRFARIATVAQVLDGLGRP